ncbi:1-phosphofructokinase [Halobacteriales archaeon QS_1_67_19]|nr:MAG: 1-phosphofructokinase [Halobacteriales archaeon QS_1_67_19]
MIVTVTLNPAVDHTLQVDALPEPGQVARTGSAHLDAGGKGINVSKYLAELGTETVATGFVGDVLGQFIRDRLDRAGIDRDFVEIGECTRLNTTILTGDEEYKINRHGPSVESDALDDVVETIAAYDPWLVLVAGSRPPGIGPAEIDRIARAGPWRTAVDVDGETLSALEADYALCKPNREELAVATDRPVATLEECLAAARSLRTQGFSRVAASLGADGAVMASDERTLHAPALDVEVVDTVGAGDAFLAGALSRLDRGESDRTALHAGVVAASRAVSVPGTDVPPFADRTLSDERVSISVR